MLFLRPGVAAASRAGPPGPATLQLAQEGSDVQPGSETSNQL